MDKFLLPEEKPESRLRYLQDTADEVVEDSYYQRLSKDELTEKRAEFTANALKVDDVETRKKEAMDEFKEELKPLKEVHKTLATEIRTGFTRKNGKLFKFIDQDTRFVYFYDKEGVQIENLSRPANSDELQNTIHMVLRNGTTND